MGVYIKGMEMPKSCGNCFFDTRCDNWRLRNWGAPPPDDCPLIEIPPHGRLIDADALAEVFRGFIAMYESCPFSQLSLPDKARRDELQSALAEVINAPTILEAEEGE